MNVVSKFRSAKKLSDPYESKIEKNHKKRVEDDVDYEKNLESDKETSKESPKPKD